MRVWRYSSASLEAATSAAALKVLVTLFPGNAETFEDLHEGTLARIRNGPHKRRGLEWGESVADQILLWRASDNADAAVTPPSGNGPGAWQPTPPLSAPYLLPQWGLVTPFAMPTNESFRPQGPPAIASEEYAEDYNEVKALGAAVGSARTPEQDLIALFWADGAGTATPPGHWNVIAQSIAVARGNTMPENALVRAPEHRHGRRRDLRLGRQVRLQLLAPVTAIRNGDSDGNPSTTGDPNWSSFIPTPPFPDYVSGHSTFSGAAAGVLTLFFRTTSLRFTAESDALPGVLRRFKSVWAAAREAALSRLYGGIHYRSANDDGLKAGVNIGVWVFINTLEPKRVRHDK
jgi:membrane-associated phospholipid phosphatase